MVVDVGVDVGVHGRKRGWVGDMSSESWLCMHALGVGGRGEGARVVCVWLGGKWEGKGGQREKY